MLRRLLTLMLLVVAVAAAVDRARHRELPRLNRSTDAHPLGAFHVHSLSSHDGQASLETIAATAESLGLDFVVVTDHNRQLAGPVQLGQVTVLSYAELSTAFGHVVALGAEELPDEAERQRVSVIGRIRELKGLPIATHPADPKRPWDGPVAHLGGVEIANLASSARRRGGPIFVGLLPTLAAYPINRDLALAQIYDRDARALQRWDGESRPEFVGICGTDAHGRPLPLEENMPAWIIVLDSPLPSAPEDRPRAVLETLKRGRFHCAAGILSMDPEFEFAATHGARRVAEGGATVYASQVDALEIESPKSSSDRPTVVLFRNGEEVMRTQESRVRYAAPTVGTYRVEVRLPIPGVLFGYRVVPVIYSNRIRVRADPTPSPVRELDAVTVQTPDPDDQDHAMNDDDAADGADADNWPPPPSAPTAP